MVSFFAFQYPHDVDTSLSDDLVAEPQKADSNKGEVVAILGSPLAQGTDKATPKSIIDALKTVYDPEIPVDIYELGLIYHAEIDDDTGDVDIVMSLTTPNCPVADSLPIGIGDAVAALPGVGVVTVYLTFSPPWSIDLMSEDARLALGI